MRVYPATEEPFGEVVRHNAARSHDFDWSEQHRAQCVYCGGEARDRRPSGLPWIDMTYSGPSLILACEGANNPYAEGSPMA